jgi:hypothetical protein
MLRSERKDCIGSKGMADRRAAVEISASIRAVRPKKNVTLHVGKRGGEGKRGAWNILTFSGCIPGM